MLHGLKKFLEYKAYTMRRDSLLMTAQAGSGHLTSALSCADIVAALFFYAMRYDPDNFNNPQNDRFILSKGHASPILYAAWKELGKVSEEELLTYRQFGSPLEGHATLRFAYAQAATGSLGMGLSIGAGIALAGILDKRDYYTYVLMGDSEISEGSIWEAAQIAAHYKLSRLIGIVDCNRLGQSTQTMHGYHAQRYAQKFEAFGWKAVIIDGHDMQQIVSALEKSRMSEDKPFVIIAKTIKGYGIERMENKEGFHGKAFPKEDLEEVLNQLERRFANGNHNFYSWAPREPSEKDIVEPLQKEIPLPTLTINENEEVATRKAYGLALQEIGSNDRSIVCLDAEVKNSTFSELFEKAYPERFFQCFVAEQNMVSMAVGLQRQGKIPFISTFASFLTRAYDQLRMAAIGTAALRVCGSHAGVSIGQDGPSQMGLEDIALFRTLPRSVIFYPSDAYSTAAMVGLMANYHEGISYIRTTRGDTSLIYKKEQRFGIGGCNILRTSNKDSLVVVAAGITLHEALKAYEQLYKENIFITVVDLYSIKPLDESTLKTCAKNACNRLITVEDHYIQGGMGDAVSYALRNLGIRIECLAVKELPMSGSPEELLSWAGIDAAAIIKKVKEVVL